MKKLFTIIALTVLFNANAQLYTTHNTTDSHGSIWMGNPNTINTGPYNSGLGLGALASNTTGNSNTASGRSSLASNTTGSTNTTSGVQSLWTNTTGSQNTALGYNAVASSAEATNQTIIGFNATGQADNSLVLGNDDVTAVYMGEDSGATVYAAGLNIGGTEITSTATELNLLTGATSLGTGILSPVTENSNTGVRLSTAVAANHGDIGSNAVDLSYSSSASTTSGATGNSSTAMGDGTTASGYGSTAMGRNSIASGSRSTAMGDGTTASAFFSTAMGYSTEASGFFSTAMGSLTEASGISSTAMGDGTTASDYGSLVIGQFNLSGSSVTNSATAFSTANTAFVIGNGTGTGVDASDAFSILFDGTTNIAGSVTADSFIKDGGVSTEFLKADGSVDSSVYITAAEVTPQADSDWDSTVSPTQILNKPTTISTQQADEITANTLKRSYPVLDEDKLATIETGAQVNVQSDWDATTGDALILNKPVITDDQQLGNFILSAGSLLSIAIERGNVVSVNLAPLLADLEAENDELEAENEQQQSQIDQLQSQMQDLIIRMEIREECACDPTLGNGDNTLQPDKAYLLQNIPNPFNNTTSVGYFVPYTNAKAHIVISTMAGQIVHNMELSNLGVGAVSIDNSRMASAVYLYTLYVDGKRIDTKRMIVE
jgi:hypothetical protein